MQLVTISTISSWQTLASNFAKKYEESIALYTKMMILDKVSPAIVKNAQIYTKKVSFKF